jgi:hypothetical protein
MNDCRLMSGLASFRMSMGLDGDGWWWMEMSRSSGITCYRFGDRLSLKPFVREVAGEL